MIRRVRVHREQAEALQSLIQAAGRAQDRVEHFTAGMLLGRVPIPAVVVEVQGDVVVVDVPEEETDARAD